MYREHSIPRLLMLRVHIFGMSDLRTAPAFGMIIFILSHSSYYQTSLSGNLIEWH